MNTIKLSLPAAILLALAACAPAQNEAPAASAPAASAASTVAAGDAASGLEGADVGEGLGLLA